MKKSLYALLFLFVLTKVDAQVYQDGMAIYYGSHLHGNPTAYGEIYDERQFTAAHLTLPHGTLVKVTRLDNNASVVVRINDRGPYVPGSILSLSKAAADYLDMLTAGKTKVALVVVGSDNRNPIPAGYEGVSPLQASRNITAAEAKELYALQVASYRLPINALNKKRELESKGFTGIFLQEDRGPANDIIIRLMIGPFTSKELANNYLGTVKESFQVEGLVVRIK